MEFNPKKEVENIAKFIKEYYKNNNLYGAVIGISGGKDSAICLALLLVALPKEAITCLYLPCYSIEKDYQDAKKICDHYNIELINFNLENIHLKFKNNIKKLYPEMEEDNLINSDLNLKPRLRMSALYYFSAMLTSLNNKPYIVIGTINKSELYVGYYTKGADNIADMFLLRDYTKEEVVLLGEYLQVPKEILYKEPSDGLSDLSDEKKLDVKYSDIEKCIKNEPLDEQTKEKIIKMNNNNKHKLEIVYYKRENI